MLLVTIDTLRADHVGAYGAERAHTPTLDALAEAGVRFEHAVSPAPITLPSHATLLTGLDPYEHGVHHNGIFALGPEFPVLAEVFGASGHATAAFVGAVVLSREYGLARGFDHYDDDTHQQRVSRGSLSFAERSAEAVTDAAVAWLENAPERWFVWVHYYDPHADYAPPPGFAAAFPGRPYAGEIAFVDAQLGRLLASIEARWPGDDTLVAVTSDHGEALGEHGESTHSIFVYEGTQRVPLLLAGPGVPAGRVVAPVVRLKDVAPTLLELAGQAPLPDASGRSLEALWSEGEAEPRLAYMESYGPLYDWGWSPLRGLRREMQKYVSAPRPELYDLAADPGESSNLAPAQPEAVERWERRLTALDGDGPAVVASRQLSPAERERLESLGYVQRVSEPAPDAALADPKDRIDLANRVLAADALLADGRAREAVAELRGIEPRSFIVGAALAGAAIAVGDWTLAEAAARDTVAAEARQTAGHARLGQALEGQGRFAEAGEAYAAMRALNPDSGFAIAGMGRAAEARGDLASARRLYAEALAVEPPYWDAGWQLAALQLEAGEDAATATLERVPAAYRHSARAVRRLVAADLKVGTAARARA
ncbi:MAG: sulfatase-like hydrolase/transferase, partial [Proteobacteria bacterium]|nr:sulfatase-like hydrolase/transferase [Pseudomonadota bacterium]